MEECIVLSDGDKLKAIREKYTLKQEEISGKDITRNLISEIESNKANITKRTAEVIIKNLTIVAKKKNFEFTETVEYLMENQAAQANKILDNYIEELKTLLISKDGSFIEILKKAESFLIDWDIKEKKIKIYEYAGDYYCNNNDVYQSVVYYEKASAFFNKMLLDKELLPLLRKLSIVYGRMGNYKKSIECCDFALNSFADMSSNDKVTLMYNNGLSYFYMKNFDKALNELKNAESIIDKDNSMYIRVLNNKANCLYEMKFYKEALKVFNKIWNLIDKNETDKYLINLINVVNSYWYAGMKDESIKCFDTVIKKLPNLNDTDLCVDNIYFEVGEIYSRLDKLDLSEQYYLKALDLCEKRKNYVLETDILCDLIELYINTNNIEKMSIIKDKILIISNIQNKVNDVLIYKLILFYTGKSDDIIKEVVEFALKFK